MRFTEIDPSSESRLVILDYEENRMKKGEPSPTATRGAIGLNQCVAMIDVRCLLDFHF